MHPLPPGLSSDPWPSAFRARITEATLLHQATPRRTVTSDCRPSSILPHEVACTCTLPSLSKGRPMAIPVGKQLDADKCPPILRSIDELWGYRCTSLHARHAYTNSLPAHIAARRLTDIYEMRTEERNQPLANGHPVRSFSAENDP